MNNKINVPEGLHHGKTVVSLLRKQGKKIKVKTIRLSEEFGGGVAQDFNGRRDW